jgi:hypothetical protein
MLLQTPDGNEGQSTLPAEVMPAGHPGVVVVGGGSSSVCHAAFIKCNNCWLCAWQHWSQLWATLPAWLTNGVAPSTPICSMCGEGVMTAADRSRRIIVGLQAGTVMFDGEVRYSSYEQWAADEHQHCVPPGTPYSWQPGKSSSTTSAPCCQ